MADDPDPPPYAVPAAAGAVVRFAAAAVLGILLIAAGMAWRSRDRELDHARLRAARLDLVLAELTDRVIDGIDLVLTTTADAVREHPAVLSESETWTLMRARLTALPAVRSLNFVDPSGRVRATSRSSIPTLYSVESRDYFRALKDRTGDRDLYVGPVLRSQIDGKPIFFLARRVQDSSGQFLGVVAAAVDLDDLKTFYGKLELGPGSAVALRRTDGSLLVGEAEAGAPAAWPEWDPAIAPIAGPRSGCWQGPDGETEIYAARRLRHPLMMVTTFPERITLEGWREDIVRLGLCVGSLSVAVAVLAAVLRRHIVLRERARQSGYLRLKRAWRALRASQERLHLAVEAADLGIWLWDLRTGAISFSERCRAHHGIGAEPISHETLAAALHPDDVATAEASIRRALASGQDYEVEYRVPNPDGTIRWIHSRGRARRGPDGSVMSFQGITCDATARYERERERRLLLGRIVSAQEEERGRVAHELHDVIGHALTTLLFEVRRLAAMLTGSALDEASKIEGVVAGMSAEVNRIGRALRPAVLDRLGLEAALQCCIADWSAHCGVRADLVIRGFDRLRRLPTEMETGLYRIALEALANIAKHAEASSVSVILALEGDAVALLVEDDGRGFDPHLVGTSRPGLGLAGMRERATLVSGTLEIDSAPGQGTTIVVRAPLPRAALHG